MKPSGSSTAKVVAFFRALVGVDPLAHRFIGHRGRRQLRVWRRLERVGISLDRIALRFISALAARSVFFDRRVEAGLADGIDQVVLLGAGFDTRIWRLPAMAAARVYLVDHPATAAVRAERSADLPQTGVRVDIDFNTDDLGARLAAAGFDRTRRSIFVWEGVAMYLERSMVRANLESVLRLAAPGSRLLFDAWYSHSTGWRRAWRSFGLMIARRLGEPLLFIAPAADVIALCEACGWRGVQWIRSDAVPGVQPASPEEILIELEPAAPDRGAEPDG